MVKKVRARVPCKSLANWAAWRIICAPPPGIRLWRGLGGRSSGVERNLAKVEVVSSNLIARSISPLILFLLIFIKALFRAPDEQYQTP